jgi:hypothetical protein
MAQKPRARGILKAWFPNRLNVVIALLLLPFWLIVAWGFFSMFFHARGCSHAKHHAANPR